MLNLKTLTALALFLSLASNSFAGSRMITVEGEKAINLIDALEKAGVKSPKGRNLSYEASDVKCAEGGGIVALPMHCSLTDARFRSELNAGEELFSALKEAGVKPSHVHQGELNETYIDVSDIYCGPGLEDRSECTIEL
ncbi:MAG: hypothetical protein ACXVB9_16725 [Bdellovibrionota bacterium]